MAAHRGPALVTDPPTGNICTYATCYGNILLSNGIEGYLRASELSRERVEDARTALTEGSDIEARVIGVDRKKIIFEKYD